MKFLRTSVDVAGGLSPVSVLLLSVYCPAGCKDVPGEVTGNSEQGYRDVSRAIGPVLLLNWLHIFRVTNNKGKLERLLNMCL
jgi:hypothetical protein